VRDTLELPTGIAAGYRAAMHGLCIRCHEDHEREQAIEKPYLSRCTTCHRDRTGKGEDLRLREGWTLSANLEIP